MSLVTQFVSKQCPGAGEQKQHVEDAGMFASDRSRTDGLAPYCRKCAATKQREWKARNPEKVRAQKLKARERASAVDSAVLQPT
jgi:hypothetical protein